MKAILILILVFLSLSQEQDLTGGWTELSLNSNDANIYRAIQVAARSYALDTGANPDNVKPLIIQSQVVNGLNYKICFVDTKQDFTEVYEYIVYKPIKTEEEDYEKQFLVSSSKSYVAIDGTISFDNNVFQKLEADLKYLYSKLAADFQYINYIYPIENDEYVFYISRITTSMGGAEYALVKNKKTGNYFELELIRRLY